MPQTDLPEPQQGAEAGALIARRHDTLATLEPVWRHLETAGTATAFQRFDWIGSIESHLARPNGIKAFVVEVSDATSGETLMLLPFVLKTKATHSVIEFMGLNVCDISAPLLAPGYDFPERSGEALWRAIGAVLPKADLVHIDLIDARHPQTILAYGLNGKPLPVENGAPLRVRVERQLGYKMPKYLSKIELVDSFANVGGGRGGYWEDNGYDWYGGI